MSENKKYWYIQLNVNFFEDERIDWLCEQKNGYAYVVLYLKLCLKTANNNGILTRQIGDMIIPYNVDKIAEVTHMNVDVVRVALELYKRIGLVYEADENNNFMRLPEVPGMVGYTTQAAIEKARYREKKKLLETGQLKDSCQDNVRQELRVKRLELRDNSLELEKEPKKEKNKNEDQKKKYGEFENVLLSDTEREKLDDQLGDICAEDYIEKMSAYIAQSGTKYKSHYAAILTWWRKDGKPVQRHTKIGIMPPDNRPRETVDDIFGPEPPLVVYEKRK